MAEVRPKTKKVYFEVTNYCNFRCGFCPINVSCRPWQHMDLSLFAKGVDDVVENNIAEEVGLHLMGEPLLYPHLYEAIEYANEKGLRTQVTTNGSLLTEERVQKLVDARLDKLTISLQMFGEAEHANRQTSIPFNRYYRRILEALRHFHNGGGRTEVTLLLMNAWTQRFLDFDNSMKVDWNQANFRRTLVTVFQDVCAETGRKNWAEHIEEAVNQLNLYQGHLVRISDQILVTIRPLFDWGNAFTAKKIYPAKVGYCSLAFSSIAVLSNGQVSMCCGDYDGQTSLGNLNERSLASILSSDRAQEINQGFRRLKIIHPYCQRCIGGTSPFKMLLRVLFTICAFRILGFGPGKELKEAPLFDPGLSHSKSPSAPEALMPIGSSREV
jgi:radical SAM protein with 4Fe4S-binding SPASM domain